jgi:hypothetical protein
MTAANARTAANVVLVSAGVAAACVVLTKPALRRVAMRGMELWLGASLPIFLFNQAREAWIESAADTGG